MRITNKMMTNNMMNNINKNKTYLSKLDAQYSTGKRIQTPSDDPIIAVRALKLRTNLSELNQYYQKNIPDAISWMNVTEGSLDNINDILTQVNTYCVQGTSDTLTASDRESIIKNLEEYKNHIYQEGNANYAGRYMFTGYKTDTSLVMETDATNLDYTITETFSGKDMNKISKVEGTYEISDYNGTTPALNDFTDSPTMLEKNRLRLSYDNLKDQNLGAITYTSKAADGTITTHSVDSADIIKVSVSNQDAYKPADDTIHFIPETGELIFSDNLYHDFRLASDITITYEKDSFKKGDLRPEHYFDSTLTDSEKPELGLRTFTNSDQQIQYEINFNQKLTVNTQAKNAIQHGIGRDIDDILDAVQDVIKVETKIVEVDKLLEDKNITEEQKSSLNELKDQLETELTLKNKIMHDTFAKGISTSTKHQDTLNVALSDLGSRYVRLELTENRLSSQQIQFEELLSINEDADLADTIIRYNAAETMYNASLSAASKIIKNTLLDFL
jgi:flagellar hook-associated protein 3 FlgL